MEWSFPEYDMFPMPLTRESKIVAGSYETDETIYYSASEVSDETLVDIIKLATENADSTCADDPDAAYERAVVFVCEQELKRRKEQSDEAVTNRSTLR